MSVISKRIMARVLEQIKEDDLELREFYQLRVTSLVEGTDMTVESAYTFAKQALYELARVQWEFEDVETKEWYLRPLLDGTKERRVGIKDGTITIILNPQLAPYFVNIAGQYSTYKLEGYLGLHSWYSMRFFEILSSFRVSGWWEVSLEKYREVMDCGPELDKYGQIKKDKAGKVKMKLANASDLIAKTVLGAQKELQTTPYAFDYHPVYEQERVGRGRRKIVGLRFDLQQKQLTAVPPSWLTDKDAGPVIANLRSFKVTDKNIALYLKTMTLAGARKLLYEWRIKENSQQKIDDKTKYCNAVFVRAAKVLIEERKELALADKRIAQQALFPGLTT
ncbi:hypothetical protein BEN47_10820 [Hymenobacter lapidarius]|uniref:Initiator Rep protein WH1 domain-containing protein n=2 Tax=Hymenobacter lapidarius TaxID=1908237 RepID=A0A1G1T980_9BACT|nr:hypothetical protein BEN47_10820 [Hymenobacter lapidarius]